MITEGYGGTCPYCGYTKTLIRHGSHGWWQFDACPRCGFAYGANGYGDEDWGMDVWTPIIGFWGDMLESKGLEKSITGIFLMIESWKEQSDDRKQVFQYKDVKSDKKMMKQHGVDVDKLLQKHKSLTKRYPWSVS